MTRSLKGSLLIASMLVVLWTTSSEACHWRRRACQPTPSYCQSGYTYGSPTGYYSSGQGGYTTTDGGYYGGGYAGGTAGYPSGYGQPGTGYDFGRPGYNPGGLGGPASGIGVRPGLALAASAPGADRPQVLTPWRRRRPGPTGSLRAMSAAARRWARAAGYRTAEGK